MQKNALRRAQVAATEVPVPRCGAKDVLLSSRYSLISAGTETASVKRNLKDMVVKAATDPEIRESVRDMLLKDGVGKTADRVHFEMTKWTPLGYSGAGVAIDVGDQVEGIAQGDPVAYGGQGHAEYIRAGRNLCVPVPEGVELSEAAFVAVGSIALQAVRRAEVQVGDVVVVQGLGLVGQLVTQILQAAGARVLGVDMIRSRLELAESLGLERGFAAGDKLPAEIIRHTGGRGADGVVVCASGSSSQVIEQAVAMARDRGRLTVVGMINLDVPCEDFYRKELDLVISRSYGPGRYDPQYEQHGVDYPVGYVRWTEKRNMEEFLRLIRAKKVNVGRLVSHEFGIDEAADAYDTLVNHPDRCLAVLLRYDHRDGAPVRVVPARPTRVSTASRAETAGVAVAGCGAFARQFHLPNLKRNSELRFRTLAASSGQSAREMADRYGAEQATTDFGQVLTDPQVDAVMIFTRDNSHGEMTRAALEAGKHVFCEKPLATSYEQCRAIGDVLRDGGPLCMVGFNRRFAPLMGPVKETLDDCGGPRMIHYRVNAGPLPADNWVYDPEYAAGRVVGEVCHFVDLMTWLVGAEPRSVVARAPGGSRSLAELEDVTATFQFADGSVGTVLYTAAGSSAFPKERLEVFTDGTAIALDDFRRLTIRGRRRLDLKNRRGDKGHDAEMQHFADAVLGRSPLEVTHRDGIRGTVCCLKLFESVISGEPVEIDAAIWV